MRADFDAVLLAWGAMDPKSIERWGLAATSRGIQVDKETYATNLPKIFAAGNAVRGKAMVVRSVADGKEAAVAIDQFLSGQQPSGTPRPFSTRMGRLENGEVASFLAQAGAAARQEPSEGEYTIPEVVEQAGRCLHCDCRGLSGCKLRRYAEQYGADPNRFRGQRHRFEQFTEHALVIYEPGKCIQCGLCVQIAAAAGEPLGLTLRRTRL